MKWHFLFLACVLASAALAQSDNLLTNPGFEESGDQPEGWSLRDLPQGVTAALDDRFTNSGVGSFRFGKRVQNYWPYAELSQSMLRDPEATGIRVGAMIKASRAFKLVIEVQFRGSRADGKAEFSKEWAVYVGAKNDGEPPADFDWEERTGSVAIPEWAETITLAFQLYGPGTVWIDDAFAEYTDDTDLAEPESARMHLPEQRAAGGNDRMTYFLHRPDLGDDGAAPEGGWPLLVVLPGGDGSADFQGFVNAIGGTALSGRYLVAQLVAPVWSENENRVVWPTAALPDRAMGFGTEDFVRAVHAELADEFELHEQRCYLLGWSSGGPPSYYTALQQGSPFSGAMVAMSVFKPGDLPRGADADGKAFYILHSPEDFIQMRFPELAERRLKAMGAATTLETYAGGHGWHGDVHGMIRAGVEWLELNPGG